WNCSKTGGRGLPFGRYGLTRSLRVRGAGPWVPAGIKRADVLRQGHVDDVFDQESHQGIELRSRHLNPDRLTVRNSAERNSVTGNRDVGAHQVRGHGSAATGDGLLDGVSFQGRLPEIGRGKFALCPGPHSAMAHGTVVGIPYL